jgi:uncharacterized Zn finger protein
VARHTIAGGSSISCKHLIAAALAFNELSAEGRASLRSRFAVICARLDALSREELVELLLLAASRDEDLFAYLDGDTDADD